MKKKPKSWHTCEDCGDKFFPKANKQYWSAITVTEGNCPDCDKKKVTLIPISDFQNLFD